MILNYAGVTPHTAVISFAAKKVCLGPVKRATSTDFVAKSTTTFYFLQQPKLLQDRIESGQQTAQLCFSTCFAAMWQNKLHSYQLPLGPMYTNR